MNRLSEIAGRLGHPATSLSRPLARLIEMGLVRREIPFGAAARDTKRSCYRIHDPFLAFFYRFVAPNRSRLGAGQVALVAREMEEPFAQHVGQIWEELVRASLPWLPIAGIAYEGAGRWWGGGLDGKPLEIDVIARSPGPEERFLAVEVKRHINRQDVGRYLEELRRKVGACPVLSGKPVACVLFTIEAESAARCPELFTTTDVLAALDGHRDC